MQRSWYRSWVVPTWTISAGGSAPGSRHASKSDLPGGVARIHGSAAVPDPAAVLLTMMLLPLRRWPDLAIMTADT